MFNNLILKVFVVKDAKENRKIINYYSLYSIDEHRRYLKIINLSIELTRDKTAFYY